MKLEDVSMLIFHCMPGFSLWNWVPQTPIGLMTLRTWMPTTYQAGSEFKTQCMVLSSYWCKVAPDAFSLWKDLWLSEGDIYVYKISQKWKYEIYIFRNVHHLSVLSSAPWQTSTLIKRMTVKFPPGEKTTIITPATMEYSVCLW